ncbi:uncharacterized protein KD926_000087 [Aspergillus affinis]|uniref:uncharacterized protein n=1 Tax=Aspergillus affinis TaxID=1070780 RepID=UPI0022FE1932|nr:uncharacterized protein KD926_000087 [Aspergillus affinis]KAI9037671.1 hypothetical protein KD926_000087 [Aspergillus affinis]
MAPIDEAIAELKSLKPEEQPNFTFIAKKHGVNRTTLTRRFRGVQHSKDEQYEDQRLLNDRQAKVLISNINRLSEKGLYISSEMLQNLAREISGKQPGKLWPGRFLKRHNEELISCYTTGIDSSRKRADSAWKYALYFELLTRKIQEYDIRQEDIYNMDEKGIMIGVLRKAKRIFSKQSFEKGLKQRLQDGNREWITTIACICADGTSLSPGLIYQAVSSKLQDTWLQDFNPDLHTCFFASSPSGWTNDELGYAWLRDVFDRETKEKARRRWRLLILDSHGSHVNMKFFEYCEANKILLMTYPPHSTHSLQPLDVGIFGPLSTAYSTELERFLNQSQGLCHITKRDFFHLFWPSWESALSPQNVESSWKTAGVWPLNPEIVLSRFNRKDNSRPSSSGSSRSALGAEDWRKIERLLKHAVTDLYDQKAEKLNSTMHALSTENIILKLRCQGLEAALLQEKKKRKRGKPLLFELQAPEDGYAVFYSPNKIQQARDLQAEKDEAIQLAKASEEERLRKQREKQDKRLLIEERKRIRASNREIRLREAGVKKQKKQDDQLAKQADIQIQNDFNLAQKGKNKVPATPKAKKSDDRVAIDPEVVNEAPPALNRRGRQIRLPQRFRD